MVVVIVAWLRLPLKPQNFSVKANPIGNDGLCWSDLQQWWGDTEQITDATQAKRSLYARLKASLPRNSPLQTLLFDAFFERFRSAVPNLPALLPEVWLHWDPRTVKERGPDALLRFRMDFLLLLPKKRRNAPSCGIFHFLLALALARTRLNRAGFS